MEQFEFAGDKNPKIYSMSDPDHVLKLYLSKKDLADYEVFTKFIHGVMAMVHKDPRYTNYKGKLYELGLTRCQVFSNITVDMAPLEMHHGPIFNLFEVCAIAADHLLAEDQKLDTFTVADIVLREHEKHHIQVVMLCETAHEAAENQSIFLSYKQGWGKLDKFLKKFRKGLRIEHYELVRDYLRLSKEHKATDNGVFEIIERIKKYVKP